MSQRKLREATSAANVYPGLMVPLGVVRRQWPLSGDEKRPRRRLRSRRKRRDPGYRVGLHPIRFTKYPFGV